MTNEQKAAVQKAALAAARSVEQRDTPIATAIERSGVAKWFKAGAQTILENPSEWGLWKQHDVVKHVNEVANEAAKVGRGLAERQLQSQLTKYREALEDVDRELAHEGFANSTGEGVDRARDIIKEVLKQEK